MKSKRLLKLIVLISLVAVLAVGAPLMGGCRPTAPPPEVEPINWGAMYALSGYFASAGEDMHRGTVLALEQVGYEVAGRPIKFIWEDNQTDATVALDKARKLIETDKVSVITGMTLTAGWDSIGPYITRMKVPGLSSSGCTERQMLAGWPLWAHTGCMAQAAYPLGVYAYEELGYRTASCFTYDAEFARGYMKEGFIAAFEERGGKILQEQYVPLDTLDFTPYYLTVPDADVFVLYLLGESILPGVAQAREIGLWDRMPVVIPLAEQLFDEYFLDESGELTVGLVGEVDWSMYWDTSGNEEFVEAFRERWGLSPGVYAAGAYCSVQIVLNAIERTGGDVSFEALSKALDETDMDTVRGHMTFADRMGSYDGWIMKHVSTEEPRVEVVAIYRVEPRIVGDRVEVTCVRVK